MKLQLRTLRFCRKKERLCLVWRSLFQGCIVLSFSDVKGTQTETLDFSEEDSLTNYCSEK